MNRFVLTSILLAVLATGPLLAAGSPKFSAPVLGYAFDAPSQTIRTISGVPGAASFGDTIPSPVALTSAQIHSTSRSAIVTLKTGGIALFSWNGEPTLTTLEAGAAGHVAFNRSGTQVALAGGYVVELWSTQGTPQMLFRRTVGEPVSAVAVAPDGAVAAVTGSAIVEWFEGHENVLAAGNWSALAYAGSDLLAVDAEHGQVTRIARDGARSIVASLPGSASSLVALGDGKSLALATAEGVLLIPSGVEPAAVNCACRPSALDALAGGFAVHLRGTNLILDYDGTTARLTALPVIGANAGGLN